MVSGEHAEQGSLLDDCVGMLICGRMCIGLLHEHLCMQVHGHASLIPYLMNSAETGGCSMIFTYICVYS